MKSVPIKMFWKRIWPILMVCIILGTLLINALIWNRERTVDDVHYRVPPSYVMNMIQSEDTTEHNEMSSDKFLQASRFDVIVQIVYAYYYVFVQHIPKCINLAYTEHIRTRNNFQENCLKSDPIREKECKPKTSKEDFIAHFHNVINDIKENGMKGSNSVITVSRDGYLLDGAQQLSASIVLSKPVSVRKVDSNLTNVLNFEFFKERGLREELMDIIMLEYMKIQFKFNFATQVTIMSLFTQNSEKDEEMKLIVKRLCSKDGHILYIKNVTVTKAGMEQLMHHMYGEQSWIRGKILDMHAVFFKSPKIALTVRFLFFLGKNIHSLKECKNKIRTLYNEPNIKSSVHIPDAPDENLILAEMILNNNSLLFLNNAKNGQKCRSVAKEMARRSSLSMSKTMPGMYVGREDIMIDSGGVLDIFGIRKGTDIDILFLNDVENTLLGRYHGLNVESHAFVSNNKKRGRPWGEEHLNSERSRWDLFYDTHNYGYCYGLKLISLEQLIRYKTKRNEPGKDIRDVKLVQKFLEESDHVT